MKTVIIFLALLVLSTPSIKSLLIPGSYTSHDLQHHIIRQVDMDKLLSEGQFPPRWSGDLNKGYGYPLFLFNYPLPPLFGEIFVKSGAGFIESIKLVMLTSMVISVLGMYFFLNSLLKSKAAAFVGAIFYLYAPIRFIVIYVSAAVGSALALGILPFVFWALTVLSQKKSIGFVLLGSLSLFGLITSHNVTTLMFFPLILVFSAFLVAKSKDKIGLFKYYFATYLLGFGLAAFFWLPALLEKSYTRYDIILPRFWADHFPTLMQLIRSPWGYGLSNPGLNDGMSFQIGLVQMAVMLFLAIYIFPTSLKLRGASRKKKEFLFLGTFSLLFFLISVFLMLEISTPFWDFLPFLGLIQFPFRFLAVAVFCAAIAAALLVKYLPFGRLLLVLLIVLVIYANRNHLNVNQRLALTDSDYASMDATSTMLGEHLPPWGEMANYPSPGKFEIIDGLGEIDLVENKSARVVANIKTNQSSKIRFNQFYFPGWGIEVNGQKTGFDYLEKGESYGLPVFSIPSGNNLVKAMFRNTFVRKVGDLISIFSLLAFLVLLINLLRRGSFGRIFVYAPLFSALVRARPRRLFSGIRGPGKR